MVKVSIIIPVFNGAATIGRAVDSTLAQDFESKEIIVVDDGSTDGTSAVLAKYGDKIRVFGKEGRSLAGARNAGVAASSGKYAAFLDADDEWLPRKLEKTVGALERNPSAVLAHSDFLCVDENDHVTDVLRLGPPPSLDDMLSGRWTTVLPSAAVVRRSTFDECGGFSESFSRGLSFEDIYMWFLLREKGEFVHIDEPLVVYRSLPFTTRMRKYNPGRPVFERLVRERYGRRAKKLIRVTRRPFAQGLLQEALQEIDKGNRAEALSRLRELSRLSPTYLLNPKLFLRGFRPRNLSRMMRVLLARKATLLSPGQEP